MRYNLRGAAKSNINNFNTDVPSKDVVSVEEVIEESAYKKPDLANITIAQLMMPQIIDKTPEKEAIKDNSKNIQTPVTPVKEAIPKEKIDYANLKKNNLVNIPNNSCPSPVAGGNLKVRICLKHL